MKGIYTLGTFLSALKINMPIVHQCDMMKAKPRHQRAISAGKLSISLPYSIPLHVELDVMIYVELSHPQH